MKGHMLERSGGWELRVFAGRDSPGLWRRTLCS
jgi:hypothetical protein